MRVRPRGYEWSIALVAWTLFIWANSLVAGPQSSAESVFFVGLLRPLFESVGISSAGAMTLVVRKGAHLLEYAVLGVLAQGSWHAARQGSARANDLRFAVALVLLVPFVDEAIQRGVPGRMGSVSDSLLDLEGIALGIVIALLVRAVRERRRS